MGGLFGVVGGGAADEVADERTHEQRREREQEAVVAQPLPPARPGWGSGAGACGFAAGAWLVLGRRLGLR